MPILSGQVVTANDLNHLKPTTYLAAQTADVSGSVTDTDLTGLTITLTTETDNAIYLATCFLDFDHSASTSTVALGKFVVDGSTQSGEVVYQQGTAVTTDRMTPGNTWRGTLATAGSHTLKMIATIPANITCHLTNSKLHVVIYEVV